jgi:hypothetical protein
MPTPVILLAEDDENNIYYYSCSYSRESDVSLSDHTMSQMPLFRQRLSCA